MSKLARILSFATQILLLYIFILSTFQNPVHLHIPSSYATFLFSLLFFSFFCNVGIQYYISSRCATFWLDTCIYCIMLTTQSLVFIYHHSLTPFTHLAFFPPSSPPPPSNQWSVVCLYEFVFCLFFIFHMWMISYGICLFASDLFSILLSQSN